METCSTSVHYIIIGTAYGKDYMVWDAVFWLLSTQILNIWVGFSCVSIETDSRCNNL